MTNQNKIAIIGGGAAGLMAAGTAFYSGAQVTVFESNNRLGKKLAITGKGRCNVTNNCTRDEFLENVPRNPRFLYSALAEFSPENAIDFFTNLGVKLKTERGRRVFPESDKAIDIVNAIKDYSAGAEFIYEKVCAIDKTEDGFTVKTDKEYHFDKVIIATGGRSYPLTGSTGSGYRFARKLGHSVTAISPSLVPLESDDPVCPDLMGLSLRNVKISLANNGKVLYKDFGELLFAHFGVTGPTILSASAYTNPEKIQGTVLSIDLKPALDEAELDARILRDFAELKNRNFANSLGALLPSKLIPEIVKRSGIHPEKKVNEVNKEERKRLVSLLKNFTVPITGTRPIEEAIITRGGIEVKEIYPKTMESRLVPGLYFAGEIIDVDAYTGGYNLQIAWSTGYLAGKSAAES